jgi:hypothetical protein
MPNEMIVDTKPLDKQVFIQLEDDHGDRYLRASFSAGGVQKEKVHVSVTPGTIVISNKTKAAQELSDVQVAGACKYVNCADSMAAYNSFSKVILNYDSKLFKVDAARLIVENGLVVVIVPYRKFLKEPDFNFVLKPSN